MLGAKAARERAARLLRGPDTESDDENFDAVLSSAAPDEKKVAAVATTLAVVPASRPPAPHAAAPAALGAARAAARAARHTASTASNMWGVLSPAKSFAATNAKASASDPVPDAAR